MIRSFFLPLSLTSLGNQSRPSKGQPGFFMMQCNYLVFAIRFQEPLFALG
jgi:hypothetical protein